MKPLSKFERDRLARLKQASMRQPTPGQLPGVMIDPANPEGLVPEAPEKYPLEAGGEPTGVGSNGTTPYSSEYWKKMEKRPPGKSVREDWDFAEQPEDAIPLTKGGQVKSLLRRLRQPPSPR